jgi:RND family efflux transporter MFP subunit
MNTKLTIAALALIMVMPACSSDKEEAQTTAEASVQVKTEMVKRIQSATTVTYSGSINSASRVQIATKVMGEIESMPFDIGEEFRKGQTILNINQDQIMARKNQADAALQEAEVGLAQAERDYERYKNLYENDSASLREWENAQNALKQMKSQVERARASVNEVNDLIRYTRIKAPFNGIVAARYMEVGDLSAPGRPILDIEPKDDYKLVFTVPESAIYNLSIGDTVGYRVAVAPDMKSVAVITKMNQAGNRGDRQFQVEAELLNEEKGILRSGMFADVLIRKFGDSGLFIPEESVVQRGQLKGVYVVNNDNTILLRWIRTGKTDAGMVEVLSGLSEGETVVAKPDGSLRDGISIAKI